jgi:hypothetical protein
MQYATAAGCPSCFCPSWRSKPRASRVASSSRTTPPGSDQRVG